MYTKGKKTQLYTNKEKKLTFTWKLNNVIFFSFVNIHSFLNCLFFYFLP